MIWHCGQCGKAYSFTDYIALERTPGSDPEQGRVRKCPCGYRFHHDQWQLNTIVTWGVPENTRTRLALAKLNNEIVYLKVRVSTVDLGRLYETMFFVVDVAPGEAYDHPWNNAQWRWESKEDAKINHEEMVRIMNATPIEMLPSPGGATRELR